MSNFDFLANSFCPYGGEGDRLGQNPMFFNLDPGVEGVCRISR